MDIAWYVLPAAFLLDLILGDPRWLPHPIRWMGKAIETAEPIFRKLPIRLSISGAIFALSLILSSFAITMLIIVFAKLIHPTFGNIIEIIVIYYAISASGLKSSAAEVYAALKNNDLRLAKQKLAMIVGRDVEPLSEEGVARADVETFAENRVDGVISPLVYAAIGGAPLVMAYKMINTLDSMVGYKNDKYLDFGKASARIDDAANFIPARLSVLIIALAAQLLTGEGKSALRTGFQQGKQHASPNSGYSEAAFAGVLKIKLGGPNLYDGRLVEKPYIGRDFGAVTIEHIPKACDLMICSSLIWLVIAWAWTLC